MKASLVLALWLWAGSASAAGFRAAVVKVDITPAGPQPLLGYAARVSTGIHDRLFHRILALDDGGFQFFLVATDIALISPSVYDDFCRQLEKETGIGKRQIWWSNTHTHSAPEVGPPGLPQAFMPERYQHQRDPAYTNHVLRTLLDGVKQARAQLVPARLAIGTGFAMANINRRARDVDGKIKLGMNPYGPVDRQIGLIRVERASDQSTLAVVANYAIHGTALGGQNLQISGDVPGIVASYVEAALNTTLLFVNGAAGDTAPIYSVYPDFRSAHLSEFQVLLGDRIVEGIASLPKATGEVKLDAAELTVESPRRKGLGWTPDLGEYTRTSGDTEIVRMYVPLLRINSDTVLWAAPLELFSEIAINIRQKSPFRHTFFLGYTNGWLGYLPTKQAFSEGGYEIATSPFTDRAASDLTSAVLGALEGWVKR